MSPSRKLILGLTGGSVICLTGTTAHAAELALWDLAFAGNPFAQGPATSPITFTAPGYTGTNASLAGPTAAGYTQFFYGGSGLYSAVGGASGEAALLAGSNQYLDVTLAPNTGTMSLGVLDLWIEGDGSPFNYYVYSGAPGFTPTVGSSIASGTAPLGGLNWGGTAITDNPVSVAIDLSAAQYQGVSGTLDFRIYLDSSAARGALGGIEIESGAASGPPTAQWTNTNNTLSWNDGLNWNPNAVLTGLAAVANFTSVGAGAVTLDTSKTVGKINISGGVAYTFNQGSGGTLTIDDTGDAVVAPQINVSGGGTHTFNVPISLANGVSISASNGTNVTFNNSFTGTGPMTVGGSGTTTIGTAGQLNPTSALSLTTNAHLVLAAVAAPSTPNAQTVASLTTDGTALLDIKNNKLTVTTATPAAIQGLIKNGFNNGLWTGTNGITSTTAQADLHHGVAFKDNGAGGVVLRYSFYGDTDLNGSINFSDLVTLAQHYNSTTATWATGDFNYDNTVNFTDLVALAQNYNGVLTPGESGSLSPSFAADWSLAQSEVAAVPEPASIGLLAIGAAGLLRRRRR